MHENDVREVIIIGGAAAGYTAALYTARANMNPLVIEGFNWGGQLMITSDVENYPGYPDGVLGPEMMQEFRQQAARFGTEFITDDVTQSGLLRAPVPSVGRRRRVSRRDRHRRHRARTRASSGSSRSAHLQGRGVSYCAVCDAAFFKEREVVVVGGGDSAMEEATFLAKFAVQGHDRPPARRVPRLADHDRPRASEREDRVRARLGRRGGPGRGGRAGRRGRRPEREDGRAHRDPGRGALRRDRPRPEHQALRRPARHGRERLPGDEGQDHGDQHRRRLRGGRRAGSRLPPGGHGGRIGLHGRARRRALARRARAGTRWTLSPPPGRRARLLSGRALLHLPELPAAVGRRRRPRGHDRPRRSACSSCGFGFLFELHGRLLPGARHGVRRLRPGRAHHRDRPGGLRAHRVPGARRPRPRRDGGLLRGRTARSRARPRSRSNGACAASTRSSRCARAPG